MSAVKKSPKKAAVSKKIAARAATRLTGLKTGHYTDRRMELLFEIGAEEIPAGMLPGAVAALKTIIEKHLTAESLSEGTTVETFGGPRRLTAVVRGIIAKQADVEKEVTGPPKAVAYDIAGAPTRAAESFAEKQGVSLNELIIVTTPKGESIAARVQARPHRAEQVLEILPRVIHDLPWPRTMTWTGLKGAIHPADSLDRGDAGWQAVEVFVGEWPRGTLRGGTVSWASRNARDKLCGLREEVAGEWSDCASGRARRKDHARTGGA